MDDARRQCYLLKIRGWIEIVSAGTESSTDATRQLPAMTVLFLVILRYIH